MQKDFDKWNKIKKVLDTETREAFAYPREVWWCSLGLNVGSETDGKNDNFERTVLVMRVYNKNSMLVLPITSKEKDDIFHFKIEIDSYNQKINQKEKRYVWVKLTQARVISNRRLIRKVSVIPEAVFGEVQKVFKNYT